MTMGWDLVAVLLDGQWFDSPFIVPVAGCAMIGSIVVAGIWSGVRTREIRSHERLARIAQGLPVEPDLEETTGAAVAQAMRGGAATQSRPPNDGSGARRAGVVLVSVGLGLFLFFAALALIVQVREVLSGGAAGLIPLAIGVGFLIDARSKRRDFERYLEWARHGAVPMDPMPAPGAAVPPPPPPPPPPGAGPSAAQASDWRPLH